MQLNASIFYNNYEDKQEQDVAVTFVSNIPGLTNVPESEILGTEVDLQWQVFDSRFLNFGAAYLETEIEKWQAVSQDSSYERARGSLNVVPL